MIQIGNFPDTVNEYAARSVAGLVVILSVITLFTQSIWLNLVLLYGFTARVYTDLDFLFLQNLQSIGSFPGFNWETKL
ncbi:PF14340 domain protein [Leptospira interrogans str. UI 12621]|uniref:PF14340 domain protein n=1 Tax=Leptospira interrogans str. UI 12621 TaxID=1049937 RepID=A0A0F6HFY2_LEPIR|nr:PF14340 domain protein [Leptospira interrogans str. UI 12621]